MPDDNNSDYRQYVEFRFDMLQKSIDSLTNLVKIGGVGLAAIVAKAVLDLVVKGG